MSEPVYHDVGYGEGADLDYMLAFAIQAFDAERHNSWVEESPTHAELIRAIHQLGETIVRSAGDMVGVAALAAAVDKAMQDEEAGPAVIEELQILAAKQFSLNTVDKARRYLDLLTLLLEQRPSEPVMQYLRRVTRCYVNGFDPECLVMCRAAIDNAVRQRLALDPEAVPHIGLQRALSYARDRGWISRESWGQADTVRLRGNKAAHDDPHTTAAVLETIALTSHVIRDLCSLSLDA